MHRSQTAYREAPACLRGIASLGIPLLLLGACLPSLAEPLPPRQVEFFEKRIRPILAQECYECHSEATKARGGLLLDSREGWKRGGDSGAAIVPGNPAESLLFLAMDHAVADLRMPKAGAKLDARILADFREWIAMGAPDPRDAPPSPEQLEKDTDWTAVSARRAQWWSFQPVKRPEVPEVDGTAHPVDRFIRARLAAEGLAPSPPADPRVLARRLHFHLAGLPPTPEDTAAFLSAWAGDPDKATSDLVDRLLADPGFGEKWARHWMDWTRYADSHGSEGDPAIPHAWRYRDYLVRAINADVPLDRLVVEHFAGDLLEEPRLDGERKLNESALGLGHLRMVFHGFSPTDALDERVRFTDDQIHTATQAFLGLTVSCARCHDHKFDAISQADYYALFGIFTSALPATVAVDAPGILEKNRDELAALKASIRRELAAHWLATLPRDEAAWDARIAEPKPEGSTTVLTLLRNLRSAKDKPEAFARIWQEALARLEQSRLAEERFDQAVVRRWNLSDPAEFPTWSRYGEGLAAQEPAAAGDFVLASSGRVVARILPSGVHSNLLSDRHRAVLASAPFDLDGEYDLLVRAAGDESSLRYAVQHYPRSGTIFPVTNLQGDRWRWVRHDLAYWTGDRLHLELATAGDAPILVKEAQRSWFGLREAVLVPKGTPTPPADREALSAVLAPLAGGTPGFPAVLDHLDSTLRELVPAWGSGKPLTNAQAALLDEGLAANWLPDEPASLPSGLADLVARYRTLEAEIPSPTRAPGVWERPGTDQALYVRGDHKQPADPVPRRFLEAIDATPYATSGTGRLEFAHDLVAEKNPFTTRVLVNRVWHHLFGRGLVATPDNFGRLGEPPSHPELLDYLAHRFRKEQHWSLKALVRELVLTETWRQASTPAPEAIEKDPDNRLLSCHPLRRLEAEAIRDALLVVSGRLDPARYGPPVAESQPRRSLYLRVKRNDLPPLLTTFDFPTPASTTGKRDVTNVPAQSLALLNAPLLHDLASRWSQRLLAVTPEADDGARLRAFFETALNRPPTEGELAGAQSFLAAIDGEHRSDSQRLATVAGEREKTQAALAALLDPVRARLEGERAAAFAARLGDKAGQVASRSLRPVAHWDFEEDAGDRVGGLSLALHGSARLEQGALVVDGKGWASSPPLPFALGAKTLEATVQLATLDQAGGGVLSVQSERGSVFDSIVFAERRKDEWLAGSDFFRRTLDFNAPPETDAVGAPVHLLVAYAADGTIRCFRNGEPWGDPIRKADLRTYAKGEGEILLGLRHGTGAAGGKTLRGRILEARLYDRELTAEEARAAYLGGPAPVTHRDLEAALGESGTAEWRQLEALLAKLDAEAKELEIHGASLDPEQRRWRDLAHALFNLKEFIYLR